MKNFPQKERPILFSGEMVRAILDGRKSVTRRVVKWEPYEPGLNLDFSGLSVGHYNTSNPASGWVLYSRGRGGCWNQRTKPLFSPYGQPGDRLWVRETWCHQADEDERILSDKFWYEATDGDKGIVKLDDDGGVAERKDGSEASPWISPIFMPRKASRITLEVTGVRVERVQEITEDQAKAEGCGPLVEDDGSVTCGRRKTVFQRLWDSLNAKRGFGWDKNPWVWVVEFKRVTP